jgi:hypothetical protein
VTLILTYVSPLLAVQVSDRLLTFPADGTAFDHASNKTLVYIARDAVVTIGYSGDAYMYRTPTDQWLAELLTGLPLTGSGPRGGGVAMHFGRRERSLDIGQSVELLRRRCSTWWTLFRWSAQQPPRFVIAGWQRGRRRWRPVLWTIRYDARFDVYRSEASYPRHAWAEGFCRLTAVPERAPISDAEWHNAVLHLHKRLPADEVVGILLSLIRSAAGRSSFIGPDCMSTAIYPPHWNPSAHVRYLPVHEARFIDDIFSSPPKALPATFSPWIITPRLVQPPSITVGPTLDVVAGGFRVVIDGPKPPTDSPLVFLMTDQKRPDQPT